MPHAIRTPTSNTAIHKIPISTETMGRDSEDKTSGNTDIDLDSRYDIEHFHPWGKAYPLHPAEKVVKAKAKAKEGKRAMPNEKMVEEMFKKQAEPNFTGEKDFRAGLEAIASKAQLEFGEKTKGPL